MSLLVSNITKRFGRNEVVRGVSFEIAPGECLALIGASGCGKTTTLRMINRLIDPDNGQVVLAGEDTSALPPHQLRQRIGYVVQAGGLFPHKRLAENVGITLSLQKQSPARIRTRVEELFHLVGLDPADYSQRFPHQVSGGQRQRVGLARALAAGPELLLLDEPFAALDPMTKDRLLEDLLTIRARTPVSTLLVTHDFAEAVRFADRVAVMDAGKLIQTGRPEELISAPASEAVSRLIAPALAAASTVSALTGKDERTA